jgi:1-aminocyclopropane-1-carboxylate deaminase/D-cysteine desulfhydrase-like pyridoxal-dependent ACC family enzyme
MPTLKRDPFIETAELLGNPERLAKAKADFDRRKEAAEAAEDRAKKAEEAARVESGKLAEAAGKLASEREAFETARQEAAREAVDAWTALNTGRQAVESRAVQAAEWEKALDGREDALAAREAEIAGKEASIADTQEMTARALEAAEAARAKWTDYAERLGDWLRRMPRD